MKNFKLLLATTAILSMGALIANATGSGEQVPMDVKIKLVKNTVITKRADLDFGTIVVQGDDDFVGGLTVEMDGSGVVTATQADTQVMPLNDGHMGALTGASCDELSYDDHVSIFAINPTEEAGTHGDVTLHCTNDGMRGALIYGTATFLYDGNISTDTYTGTFVITHVLDEQDEG